ncbi:hypothetical protein TAMA11512_11880 [Selenomonas sp. TAMA-11512]|uniref:hypothetical protein n=1 Tax=Selenomonas sp. TAMA-11512 TaxID=3095337 RepID=UPI0030862970|nr:hypothetical protein TAMA11512_11880 [Selenomonas sp. TAMA-11512]
MKDEIKARVDEEVAAWAYMEHLPEVLEGYQLQRDMRVAGDVYDLFSYENKEARRGLTVYFHEETKEYKLRVHVGLTEFARIECIAGDLSSFEALLQGNMQHILAEMAHFSEENLSSLIREKHLPDWEYGNALPKTLEGFELYISPKTPYQITNGSYIVFDYTDFSIRSNFTIYYNIYRDEFFGEARVVEVPEMNYDYDAKELETLEVRLREHLVPRLQDIRQRAEAILTARN